MVEKGQAGKAQTGKAGKGGPAKAGSRSDRDAPSAAPRPRALKPAPLDKDGNPIRPAKAAGDAPTPPLAPTPGAVLRRAPASVQPAWQEMGPDGNARAPAAGQADARPQAHARAPEDSSPLATPSTSPSTSPSLQAPAGPGTLRRVQMADGTTRLVLVPDAPAEPARPMWAALVQHVVAVLPVVIAASLFLIAHNVMDRPDPDQAVASTYLVSTALVCAAGLALGIVAAVKWRPQPILFGLAGLLVVPWLLSLARSYGGYGCGILNLSSYPCNDAAVIDGRVWLVALVAIGVGGVLSGILWGSGKAMWAPGSAFAAGGACLLAFGIASVLLLMTLDSDAAAAAAANQPNGHRIPGLGIAAVAAVVTLAAMLRRRATRP